MVTWNVKELLLFTFDGRKKIERTPSLMIRSCQKSQYVIASRSLANSVR